MSKNTGTSELINYFDLGVNGDVGIAGSLDINTIANATTDTDTFLVSDTGIIKYRTGAQLLSDIGAQGLLTNPVTGTGVSGRVAFWNGTTTQTSDSQFFWDNINKRLGVGTNTPSVNFEISGDSGLSSGSGNPIALRIRDNSTGSSWNVLDDFGQIQFFSNDASTPGGINIRYTLGTAMEFAAGQSTSLTFRSSANGILTERWRMTSAGILQSNGAQTIQTSTGNLTLATAGGNGNINLVPNGTGKVGIGANSPSLITSIGILTESVNFQIFNGNAAGYNVDKMADIILANNNSFTDGTIGRLIAINTAITTADKRIAQISFVNDGAINSGRIGFVTMNSGTTAEKLRLFSTGNVLIQNGGTFTDNGARLQVSGTATFTAASGVSLTTNGVAGQFSTRINGNATTGSSYGLGVYAGTNSSDDSFRVHSYSGTQYFTVRGDGNVGIGTASPTSGKLEIQTSSTTAALWVQTGGTTSSYIIADFRTGTNLPALQILGNGVSYFGGNVGIGTASPAVALEILRTAGTASYSAMVSGTVDLLVGVDAAGLPRIFTAGANAISMWTNSTERMRITSSGNVLIGTTTDNGSKLRVSGNIQIDGFQKMYTYYIIVQPNTTGTITISSPTGTNMQGSMQVMAGGYGNSLSGNITGLWMVGGLLFFNNASTSTITQIVNSVTANGSMSFQRSSDQYTVTLANTSSLYTKTLFVSVIINGD